jgi:hypothetical protein
MDFGAAEIQEIGQIRNRRIIDIAEAILQGMQHRHQGAVEAAVSFHDAPRLGGVP